MLNFTNWVCWKDRDLLGDPLNEQGLYLLAHFDAGPPDMIELTREIIYVGIAGKTANSRITIKRRLHSFNRSASGKNAPHSGGKKYFSQFGNIRSNLYVAVSAAMKKKGIERSCHLLMMERILIWRYVQRFEGKHPICNSE